MTKQIRYSFQRNLQNVRVLWDNKSKVLNMPLTSKLDEAAISSINSSYERLS